MNTTFTRSSTTVNSHVTYRSVTRTCRRCGRPFWPSRRYAECEACRALKAEPTPIYDEVEHALELFRNRQALSALIEQGLRDLQKFWSVG